MPDFTLEEVVGYGQQQGADPATIAKAVRAWHGSTVQEARDVIPDQEKFWKGTTKVDRTVADTLNSLRNAAQLQTAAKLFPDPQEFQQFSSVLESSGYDPMKMDAPPSWIEAAKKLDAAAADPVFAPPRHQYGKIAFGPNKLADYSIRTKEDGVGYEAMVYPSDDEGKPRGAPIRVELPTREVMAQQMEEDVARKQAEFEQVSHGANSPFLSPEVSSMRARLPAIDAAYQNAQQSREAITKGTESTALHIGLNNALLNNDAFKATVPQNTFEQFTTRPILGVVRSLAEGGSAATGTGKEDILTQQGHDAMDVLTPGRLRSRWEAQGNAMMAPGDAIESGMESLVSVMLPGGLAKLAGKALPALNAASIAGKAAYGTLGATSYGSNYAGALMEAEAVRPTDPAKADRILRYAQLTSALKAGIEMATERIFPDEAAVAGMKGMTWKQARKMPLHEGAEEFAGAVGQNLVNTIDGQQNQNPLENAWQGALGSLPFIGMGRVQHMISNRNAAGPAPAVAPASTLGGVTADATLPIPPTAGSGSSPDVAAPYVQPPNASTADGNLPTGPGTVSDTLLTPPTDQDPTGTVPELPATLDEQLRRVKSGTKPGMIFPGLQPEDLPAQYRPSEHDDLVATATPAGTVLHPLDIPRADVLAAVEQNKLGQLLGYGTDSKPTPTEDAPPPVAVTLRTADGTEVDSVAADPADAPAIAAHLQSRAEPGDTVQVETPEDVLKGRLPQDPSAAETDLFGDPLPSEVTPETHPVQEIPLASLKLSKDVPQFKGDADPKTGVVEPLGGKFERLGTGPILIWERRNGDLEIISGRHRADLARRSGETTIPGQIVRESDGFTRGMALTADAELNIRDEKGSIKDFAAYFRHGQIDRRTAEERGLLARTPGRAGWAIGRDGSDSLFTLHANQKISDAAAAAIATAAPGNEALQAVGMKAVLEQRMSGDMAANLMAAASLAQRERAAAGEQGDLFGFDDSAVVEMTRQARRANAMQQAIREQITAVKGAARRPETARKLGVDVTDPEGLNRKIAQLTNDLARWENWSQQPDLVDMVRGTGENTLKEDTPDFFTGTTQDPFNLVSETPKERAAREAKELKAAQAKHAAEVARIKAEGEAMQGTLFEGSPAAIDIPALVHYFQGNGADYRNNPASADLVGTLRTVASNPAGFSEEYEQGELFGGGGNLPGKSPGTGRRVNTKASPAAVQYAEGLRFTSWQNGQPVDWKTNPRVTSIMAAMVDGTIPAWNINGAVISTPEDFVNLVLPLRSPLFESVKIAVLNDKGKVMHSQVLTVGTVGETVLMSRDVLRVLETARRMKGQGKADGVIISHNHPSGNPDPSSADRMVTRTVEASLKAVGSRLIDHIVTNGESFYSFKAQSVQNLSSPQLAPWETVTASSRRQAFGGSDIKDIVTHLRQGDGNQHGHVIYMNQRLQVVAVERVDHTTSEPLTRQMMQVASELGANHLAVDLPHVPATKAMAIVTHLKNEMPLGFRLVDAGDSTHPSYNEAGLMEPGPGSLSNPNTLREDGPNDLHPGPTPATPDYDTRRFGLRVQADERLRDAWRARFTPSLYKTFTEETLRKQIREWIADNGGLEGAASLFLDSTSGLQDFERNALGQQLALSYDLRARRLETAGNVDGMRQAEAALDQIIGTLEGLATQAGQALRAFGMWSKLSPRGITRTVQREAGRRTDAKITEILGAEPADILGAVNAIEPPAATDEEKKKAPRSGDKPTESPPQSTTEDPKKKPRSGNQPTASPAPSAEEDLQKKAQELIDSLKPKDKKTREKIPKFIRILIEARRNGALSRADFHDAFAQAFGMPRFTPEFAAEIRALAAQVEATPAGSWLRQKAQSALMTRLAQWEGIPAGEIWTAFWYANILSGIGTQAVNISGNASHLLLKTVTTALSNNPVHTVQFFRGMLSGFTQGLPQAKAAFLHGDPVLKGEEMWQKKDVLEMLWSDNPTTLGRKIAKYGAASWGRYVFRALTAADAVFYNTAKEARAFLELSRTGQAQADPATVLAAQEQAKQDLQTAGATNTPANLDRRTLEILEAQRPAEVLAAARHFGGQATFNYEPEGTMGAFQKGINLISKAVPPVRAAIPFTRIVANLADQGLDWTGYGMVRGALGRHTFNSQGKKFSGRERIERALAGAIGMATYASLYALAKAHAGDDDDRAQFMIYGGGPTDKNRREQMPKGWKPYSIKIGDHYFSYAETPLSIMLGALGASMDKQRYGIKKPGDDDTLNRAFLLMSGAAQSFGRTGIMSGLSSLFSQMDGTGSPKNFAARTASGFIPAQGLLRDIAKLMDDSKVSTATIEGVVLQNLPYLRSKAGKAYNVFGDVVREPGPWILSRLVTKQDPSDKDATWLTRNKLHIPDLDQELVIGKYLSKEEIYAAKHRAPLAGERAQLIANLKNGYLTEDQRVQFLKTSGPLIRQSLQLLQRGPQLDPKTMQSRVNTATKAAREIAMRKLIGL